MPDSLSGGCVCQAVRYQIVGKPRGMIICHCRTCQHYGGSAYSPTVLVEKKSLQLLSGSPRKHSKESDAGNTATREFCSECGTQLFASSAKQPDNIGVRAGTLDQPSVFQPTADVWVASAQPWDCMNPNVEKFQQNRVR